MNDEMKAKLEAAGYTVSNTQDFLGLSDTEMKLIEVTWLGSVVIIDRVCEWFEENKEEDDEEDN